MYPNFGMATLEHSKKKTLEYQPITNLARSASFPLVGLIRESTEPEQTRVDHGLAQVVFCINGPEHEESAWPKHPAREIAKLFLATAANLEYPKSLPLSKSRIAGAGGDDPPPPDRDRLGERVLHPQLLPRSAYLLPPRDGARRPDDGGGGRCAAAWGFDPPPPSRGRRSPVPHRAAATARCRRPPRSGRRPTPPPPPPLPRFARVGYASYCRCLVLIMLLINARR
jgi:hypothetical protein